MREKKLECKKIFLILLFFVFSSFVFSAPYDGDEFELKQPDGTYVKILVYGDEYYQRVESLDGYTLIRDIKTGWICYAKLSKNGELISTGVIYKEEGKSKPPKGIKKHLKESSEVIKAKREKAMKELEQK